MVGHPGTPAPLAPRNARHSAMQCHALHGATQAHARLTELAEFFSGERALTRVGKELVETAAVTLPLHCRYMTVTLPLQAGRDGRRPQQRRRPTALPGTHGPGRSPSTLGSGPSLSLCTVATRPSSEGRPKTAAGAGPHPAHKYLPLVLLATYYLLRTGTCRSTASHPFRTLAWTLSTTASRPRSTFTR